MISPVRFAPQMPVRPAQKRVAAPSAQADRFTPTAARMAVGAAGGAVLGTVASIVGTAVGWSVGPSAAVLMGGAFVFARDAVINGRNLSNILAPFKADAADSKSTARAKTLGNVAVRFGGALALFAAGVLAPPAVAGAVAFGAAGLLAGYVSARPTP